MAMGLNEEYMLCWFSGLIVGMLYGIAFGYLIGKRYWRMRYKELGTGMITAPLPKEPRPRGKDRGSYWESPEPSFPMPEPKFDRYPGDSKGARKHDPAVGSEDDAE